MYYTCIYLHLENILHSPTDIEPVVHTLPTVYNMVLFMAFNESGSDLKPVLFLN